MDTQTSTLELKAGCSNLKETGSIPLSGSTGCYNMNHRRGFKHEHLILKVLDAGAKEIQPRQASWRWRGEVQQMRALE